MALAEKDSEELDPWDLPELQDTGVPWSGEISNCSFQSRAQKEICSRSVQQYESEIHVL